ncbi:MAG: hypothetical protein WAM60_13800 [Candidatus Promineifilaceae bacterium]
MFPVLLYGNMLVDIIPITSYHFEQTLERKMINTSAGRKKIIDEIEQIPENKLDEVYHLVHSYRVEQETEPTSEPLGKSIMRYAGAWKDMPDEDFSEFLEEIRIRRQSTL